MRITPLFLVPRLISGMTLFRTFSVHSVIRIVLLSFILWFSTASYAVEEISEFVLDYIESLDELNLEFSQQGKAGGVEKPANLQAALDRDERIKEDSEDEDSGQEDAQEDGGAEQALNDQQGEEQQDDGVDEAAKVDGYVDKTLQAFKAQLGKLEDLYEKLGCNAVLPPNPGPILPPQVNPGAKPVINFNPVVLVVKEFAKGKDPDGPPKIPDAPITPNPPIQIIIDIKTVIAGFEDLFDQFSNLNGITGIQTPGTVDVISGIVPNIGQDVSDTIPGAVPPVDDAPVSSTGSTPTTTPITTCPTLDFTVRLGSVASGFPEELVAAIRSYVRTLRIFVDPGSFPCTFSVIFNPPYTLPLFSGSFSPGESRTGTLGATQTVSAISFSGDLSGILNITISMDIFGKVTVTVPGGSFTFMSSTGPEEAAVSITPSSGSSP